MAKANIMVVEDEGLVAMELKEELESMGYFVSYTADSGEDALKNLITARPDVILMDIQLKGDIDGIQTAQQIFSEYKIPIIYLTAYSDEKTLSRARESEPYGFLIKPFSERTLYTTIEMALSKAEKEKTVRHTWEWYSHIVKCMGEAVIVTDKQGTIRLINPVAERLTGWSYDEVSCKDINGVFTFYDMGDQEQIFALPLGKVLSQEELVFQNRLTVRLKKGKRLPVNLTLSPLINEKQKAIGVIITMWDRTVQDKSQEVIKRELNTAVNIQKSLLPKELETIYGIRSHWYFYPSPFGSGDIFNFRSLDSTHVGFYILDVMGHGFSAALFSLVLHRILTPNIEIGGILKKKVPKTESKGKRQEDTKIVSPKEVINELNKRFFFNAVENPFFSIIYGVINVRTGKTKLARAGHTYPIWQNKDGRLIQIDEGGPAIGIFAEMELDEFSFTIEPGERLIMYSDGLVDVRNHKQEHFTLQRLMDFLKRHKKAALETLVTDLKKEISEYMHHTESTDDITFFVLERMSEKG
jgi:PAS domain S-box-containing protein